MQARNFHTTKLRNIISNLYPLNIEGAMQCVRSGADLMAVDLEDNGNTLFHLLMGHYFDEKLVKELVEKEPRLINALGENKQTPLQMHMNEIDHFKIENAMCLARCKDVNLKVRDNNNDTLLHKVVVGDFKKEFVKELVSKEKTLINALGDDNYTPLQAYMNLFQGFTVENAMCLVELGADPRSTDIIGNPLFHRVIESAKLGSPDEEAIKDLITKHHIDINVPSKDGRTPLLCLIRKRPHAGKLALIAWFLSKGATLDATNVDTMLFGAIYANDLKVGQWLVGMKGANLAAKNKDQQTLLHVACASGLSEALETVAWLIASEKIDIQAKDWNGKTALTINSGLSQAIRDLLTSPDPLTQAKAILAQAAKVKAEAEAKKSTADKGAKNEEKKEDKDTDKDKSNKNTSVSRLRGKAFSSFLSKLGTLEAIEALIDPTQPNQAPRTNFIKAVEDLVSDLNTDLLAQEAKKPLDAVSLVQSTAAELAERTVNLLKILKLTPKPEDQLNAIRQYETACKATSGWQFFAKLVAVVCIAAVGFVLGAVIGMGIGIAAGAWSGPGAFVTAALGAATGAAIGVMAAATVTGLAAATLGGIALFKSSKLDNRVEEVAAMGRSLVK